MAEALGIAAGAAQFAELGVKIAKLGRDIYDRVQSAPAEIPKCIKDIEYLQTLFARVHDRPELHDATTSLVLQRCILLSSEICSIFESIRFSADDSTAHKTWKAIAGKARDDELHEKFRHLESCKVSLNTAIALAIFDQGQSILQRVQAPTQLSSEEDQCLRDLYVTDPSLDREQIISSKGDIIKGTCDWIFTHEKFNSWIQGLSPPDLLWISAPPGMGKTYLSISISLYLQGLSHMEDGMALFFFCDDKSDTRKTAVNVLRGWIYQLIQYKSQFASVCLQHWKQRPDAFSNLESHWTIFRDIINGLDSTTTVYCLIDALDECESSSMTTLLKKLKVLAGRNGNSVPGRLPPVHTGKAIKFIGISRRHPGHISEALMDAMAIKMDQTAAAQAGVASYISVKVLELANKKQIRNTKLHYHIEQTFRDRAQGTFLWVSFMTQDLERKTITEMEDSLEKLPQGLGAIYDRILSEIPADNINIVADIIRWVTLATRPLEIASLCEAINIQPTPTLTRERVCLDHIKSCGHLLLLDEKLIISANPAFRNFQGGFIYDVGGYKLTSNIQNLYRTKGTESDESQQSNMNACSDAHLTVTFFHQSAKDYILDISRKLPTRFHITDVEQAHEAIADRLIQYMIKGFRDDPELFFGSSKKLFEQFPLADYAIWCWNLHFQHLRHVGTIVKTHDSFFGKRSDVRVSWAKTRVMTLNGLLDTFDYFNRCGSKGQRASLKVLDQIRNTLFKKPIPLLHMACYLGLYNLAEYVLSNKRTLQIGGSGTQINKPYQGSYKTTPLGLAVDQKQENIVSLLLNHGVDRTMADKSYFSIIELSLACHLPKVFWLLVSTKRGKALIEKQSNKPDASGRLLINAVGEGDIDICRFLIEKHNFSINKYKAGSILNETLKKHHMRLSHILVKDWQASLGPHFDLLQSTMSCYHRYPSASCQSNAILDILDIVKTWDLDINATCSETGQGLVHLGPSWTHMTEEIARDLLSLDIGLDISIRDFQGGTLFHAQESNDWRPRMRPEVMRLLLQDGNLQINTTEKRGYTMLHSIFHDMEKFMSYSIFYGEGNRLTLTGCNGVFEDVNEWIMLALDLGADRHLKTTEEGKTALDMALKIRSELEDEEEKDMNFLRHLVQVIDTLENYAVAPLDVPAHYVQLSQHLSGSRI